MFDRGWTWTRFRISSDKKCTWPLLYIAPQPAPMPATEYTYLLQLQYSYFFCDPSQPVIKIRFWVWPHHFLRPVSWLTLGLVLIFECLFLYHVEWWRSFSLPQNNFDSANVLATLVISVLFTRSWASATTVEIQFEKGHFVYGIVCISFHKVPIYIGFVFQIAGQLGPSYYLN